MNRNESIQALPVTLISLKLIGAALEIYSDDIEDIHVMVSGDKRDVNALRINASADRLTVEQPATALAKTPVTTSWMQITLRIPRSWKGSIDARTVSGWMNLRGLTGADLSMDSVSGTLLGNDLSFITASLRAVTGDIRITALQADKVSCTTTSGNISLDNAALRTCSLNSVTGSSSLWLTQPFERISASGVSGDVAVEAPITECDATLRCVTGRIRTAGVSIVEGAPRIKATTVSGDLTISRNDQEA